MRFLRTCPTRPRYSPWISSTPQETSTPPGASRQVLRCFSSTGASLWSGPRNSKSSTTRRTSEGACRISPSRSAATASSPRTPRTPGRPCRQRSGERPGATATTCAPASRAVRAPTYRAVERPERRGPVTRTPLPTSSIRRGSSPRSSPPTARQKDPRPGGGPRASAWVREIATGSSSTCLGHRERGTCDHCRPAWRARAWTAATWAVPAGEASSSPTWTSRGRAPARKARPEGMDTGTSRGRIPTMS